MNYMQTLCAVFATKDDLKLNLFTSMMNASMINHSILNWVLVINLDKIDPWILIIFSVITNAMLKLQKNE